MRENQNISGTDGTAVVAKGLVAIPARLASTRLPNKLLLSETGKPLLAHVIERAQEVLDTLEQGQRRSLPRARPFRRRPAPSLARSQSGQLVLFTPRAEE